MGEESESNVREKVSICILTYNRMAILKDLLLSLENIHYSPIEIIVIDNYSEDGTENMMLQEFQDIRYFRTDKNIGIGARNIGLIHSTGGIVITLDDDIIGLNDSDIIKINNYFLKSKRLGALNFKVIDNKTGNVCNWIHHCKQEEYSEKEFSTYEITEGAVAFRKQVIKEAGYYTEYFFLSHEGPDLAFRILNLDYDVIYSNKITVMHSHAETGRKSWFRYYYDTRNHFFIAVRNFPVSYLILYLLRSLTSTFLYSIRDGYILYWLKGFKDGIKGIKDVIKDRNVLKNATIKHIKIINKKRPSFIYMLNKRLFRKDMRL